MKTVRKVAAACLAVVIGAGAARADGPSISISMDRADGVYAVGESVHWSVKVDGPLDGLRYAVMPGQGKPSVSGPLEDRTLSYTFAGPGTVVLKVTGKKADGTEVDGVGGAVAGPERIAPSAPKPKDFDAFWSAKIAELRGTPPDPQLTIVEAGRGGVQYQHVTLTGFRGSHVQGQVARPERGDKFPAILQVQYAGVYPLQKNWVTDRAADGWLAMNILAHDLPIDRPDDFYKAQFAGPLQNYWAIGNDDRETSYFLRMYLSCVRAVDYLKTRPDWDGRTLVVFGGSQGGQQTLVTAGLCPDVTAAMADVPAGCDMLGPDAGRKGGWPQWYDWTRGVDWHTPLDPAKVHAASRYFDVVNFASGVRCPVLVATGLVDEVVPAAGVIAAFNQIPGTRKQLLLMPNAAHQSVNDSHGPYDQRLWQQWMPALLQGKAPPVGQ